MTDMRATERLLEVIHEESAVLAVDIENMVDLNFHKASDRALKILAAAEELRRRGDTLVRADDVRAVLEDGDVDPGAAHPEAFFAAIGRLENAIGGKLR